MTEEESSKIKPQQDELNTLNEMISHPIDTTMTENNNENKQVEQLYDLTKDIASQLSDETKAEEPSKTSGDSAFPPSTASKVPIIIPSRDYSSFSSKSSTINEAITETILRDLYYIYSKLKYVVNPFVPESQRNNQVRQWDLWGPLLFTIMLAGVLCMKSKEKTETFTLIFVIFWVGSALVHFNANLLGVKASIFQIFCLLGYSLFPMVIGTIALSFGNYYEILRFMIVAFTCFWSCYSMSGYLQGSVGPEQKMLVLYPAILLYLFISGIILMMRDNK